MGDIHVQFESLESGAQGIRNNYSQLNNTLEQLNSDLQPMINSWSGSAQSAYMACKKQWDDASTSLAQVLSTIGTAVGQAHENYMGAENAAQANWG